MSALAGPIIGALEDALNHPSDAGGGQEGQDVFNANIQDLVGEIGEGVLWVFGQVYGSWKWSLSRAQQIGKDFETIQGANQSSMQHIVDNVLPNSLAYLNGLIFSTGIVPLRNDVRGINTKLTAIAKWQKAIDTWRTKTVDPDLAKLNTFLQQWSKTYEPAVKVLLTWLRNPGTLATYVAGPIIAPLVGQLGTDAHKPGRDALTVLMVRSWDEQTNPVWEAILQWVVSDK